jgi:hypothetical protein
MYQASTSGTVVPTGEWTTGSVPAVSPGQYLWTRVAITFSSGAVSPYYSVAYRGLNGNGAVNSVNEVQPDANGNVTLTALDIPTADDPDVSVEDKLNSLELVAGSAQSGVTELSERIDDLTPADIGAVAQSDLGTFLSLTREDITYNLNAAATGTLTRTVTAPAGYSCAGVVGYNTGSTWAFAVRINVTRSTGVLTVVLRNTSATANIRGATIAVELLWYKNG